MICVLSENKNLQFVIFGWFVVSAAKKYVRLGVSKKAKGTAEICAQFSVQMYPRQLHKMCVGDSNFVVTIWQIER